MMSTLYDCLIVGGGPAGLSVALGLARQRHTCIVFDSESYRNDTASTMHNVLTWDHRSPLEFREAARDNIPSKYKTVDFEQAEITELRAIDNEEETTLFEASDALGRKWQARKVALTTGTRDVFPDIKGYAECGGKGIFNCIFCHGLEEAEAINHSGFLDVGAAASVGYALHVARMNLQLTPSGVTLYTNGETDLTTSFNEALDKGKAIHINVETRKIARLEMVPDNEGIMIHFEDETYALEAFLAHRSYMEERSTLAQQLGLEKNDDGDIIAKSPFNETSVRGVFASGDNVGLMKVATHAMWTGSLVGCGVACQLQADASGHRGLFDC